MIRGSHADINPAAVGRGLEAMIAVRLRLHTTDAVAALSSHLHAVPEVVSYYHVTGADDFLVHVAVAAADDLRSLVLRSFTSRPEIARTNTSLIFHHEQVSGVVPLD